MSSCGFSDQCLSSYFCFASFFATFFKRTLLKLNTLFRLVDIPGKQQSLTIVLQVLPLRNPLPTDTWVRKCNVKESYAGYLHLKITNEMYWKDVMRIGLLSTEPVTVVLSLVILLTFLVFFHHLSVFSPADHRRNEKLLSFVAKSSENTLSLHESDCLIVPTCTSKNGIIMKFRI